MSLHFNHGLNHVYSAGFDYNDVTGNVRVILESGLEGEHLHLETQLTQYYHYIPTHQHYIGKNKYIFYARHVLVVDKIPPRPGKRREIQISNQLIVL